MNLPHFFDLAVRQFAQVSIAILVVAVITRLFCRRRPHLEYVLWLLVVLKSLTPPIWSSPTSIFSLMSWQPQHDTRSLDAPIAADSIIAARISTETALPAVAPSASHQFQIPYLLL